MNQELAKNKILDYRKLHKHDWYRYVKKDNELYKWILENSKILENEKYANLATRIYFSLNEITSFDDEKCRCKHCHEIIKKPVDDIFLGYTRCCSVKCAYFLSQPKREQSMLEKYGAKSFLSSDAGKQVKSEWCKANGVTNPFQLESVKQKSNQSRKEHFGYEYTMQSPEKRKLAASNYKKKTGYEHQFSNPEVVQKIRKTQEENKLSGNSKRNERFHLTMRKKRYEDLCLNEYVQPLFSFEEFISEYEEINREFKWKCLECGNEFVSCIDQNFKTRFQRPARCLKCHPIDNGISDSEKEIVDFVKTIYDGEILENTRSVISPYELDIYLPDKKLGIEFDGLFWHSEFAGKVKNYHLNKTKSCEALGIQLIHIFEDEWIFRKDIVKSRLKNLLGLYDNKCYARQCEVKEISLNESQMFQQENHIQYFTYAKINIGLYFNHELVSLMTFSKPRFSKKYDWELVRFCNKIGWHIPGAASKLLSYFEKKYNPKSIVSYADRRWSVGNLYEKLGFKLDHESRPNYWYFKQNNGLSLRESRVHYQKYRLKKLLKDFDPTKTEIENMEKNGYHRIFDCGNLVYVKFSKES